jgi:hypothetical protein
VCEGKNVGRCVREGVCEIKKILEFSIHLLITPHTPCLICVDVALKREVEGDLFVHDMGQGLGFRPGSFDGAIRLALWMWLLSCQFCHTFCKSPSNFLSSIIWYTHFSDVVSHSIHVNVSHGCSVHTHNGSFHYKPPLLVTFPLL